MYGVLLAPIENGEVYGAKNLDYYRSTAEFYETFGRFENFSFSGSGGAPKVRVTILKWDPK